MAPKRKSTTTTTQSSSKQQKKPVIEQILIMEEEKPIAEEEIEQIEEELIEEEEEEVDEDDEELEEDEEEEDDEDDEEDEESISKLIDPFTKEQLITILKEAAEKHPDVASRVRNLANMDTVHRKIFVHGLGWETTTDTLRSTFEDYGEIEDCKAVADKLTGKSKGYGFILFKTRGGAKKALREPRKVILGRMVGCQLAAVGPVGNVAGSEGVGATEITQRKIYVSNVSAEVDPVRLKGFFSRFGEIEEGPLGIDKSTGKFKGFCLFVYKSVESAKKALVEPIMVFEGHSLNCQRAIDEPRNGKGGSGSGNGRGGVNHGSSLGGGNHGLSLGGGFNATAGLMPAYGAGVGGLNPAFGQALTALIASQGAGLGLNSLLGGGIGVPGAQMGQGGAYGGFGGYGIQGRLQSAYPNQQMGQGGSGRSQYGYNGKPFGGR